MIAATPTGVRLTVHAQPGAARSEIAGVHGDAIKVRLAAPPVDGKANEALLRFLAELFGIPLRQVTLVRGMASRTKVIDLVGVTPEMATRVLCL
ncbi:MAG: DUF167 domain-containing protein [Gemmatimonadota bacterium]